MSDRTPRILTDKAEIKSLLERDRVWAGYSLGDLDEGMFEQCDWYGAGDTLAHTFKGLSFIPFFTMGQVEDIEAIVGAFLKLPKFYLYQRPEHVPAIEKYYTISKPSPMWRMVVSNFQPFSGSLPVGARLVMLGSDRLADMRALYATENGADAFAAFQLAMGFFYGVEQDGALVSAAGIHLVSPAQGVAAVGNVFTHPAYRGRGYAAACVGATVAALQAAGSETIILNVEQRNLGAIRIYERLGFVKYCEFIEGYGERKI